MRKHYTFSRIIYGLACICFVSSTYAPASIPTTSEPAGKPVPASLASLERQYYDLVKRFPTKFTPSIPGACEKCSTLVPSYSDFIQSGKLQQPKYAYATFISTSQFVASAAVMLHSLALTGTRHARVALVTPYVTQDERVFLAHFARVIVVDLVQHNHYISNKRYRDQFTKLRLWQLTMYTKVIYFDADVVLLRSIDELFDLPTWAVPMDATSPRYGAGMMLMQPSLERFDDMIQKIQKTKTSMELPDLLFLTDYINNLQKTDNRNVINLISRWYQVYQEEFRPRHKTYLTHGEESITIYDHRIHAIHYAGADKPWTMFPQKFLRYAPSFCAEENLHPFPNDPHFVWYSMYSKMRRSYSYMNENATDEEPPLNLNNYLSGQQHSRSLPKCRYGRRYCRHSFVKNI